jgi:hypothetical protein
MRLAEVEKLRLRLSAADAESVMAKLAGYLNSATIYLESYLSTGFAEAEYDDLFYIEPNALKSFTVIPTLALSSRFVGNDLVLTAYSSAASAAAETDGIQLAATEHRLDADKGVVKLLEDFRGKFIRAKYTAGFEVAEDEDYGDVAAADQDVIPNWLEEAALSMAARLYQAESREMEAGKLEASWNDVKRMVEPHRRMNVSSFSPLP